MASAYSEDSPGMQVSPNRQNVESRTVIIKGVGYMRQRISLLKITAVSIQEIKAKICVIITTKLTPVLLLLNKMSV